MSNDPFRGRAAHGNRDPRVARIFFPGSGKLLAQDEEVRRFKREVEVTRQERDILKKQWASFRARRATLCVHCRACQSVSSEYHVSSA